MNFFSTTKNNSKKKKMKTVSRSLPILIFLSLTSLATWAQNGKYGEIEYAKAINISGKQRMLSQKIAKDYILMAKGISSLKIEKEFKSSKFIFERQLKILEANSRNSTEKFALKRIKKLWEQFGSIVNSPPSYANAQKIMEMNTPLLSACNQLVKHIEENSQDSNQFGSSDNNELMNTINLSGKQRMLSQRYCLYKAASKMFPKEKNQFESVANQVYTEFDNAIGTLLISNLNTTNIEEELGIVMSEWEKIQNFKSSLSLKDVFISTNFLTTRFNLITAMYEGLTK